MIEILDKRNWATETVAREAPDEWREVALLPPPAARTSEIGPGSAFALLFRARVGP